MSLCARFFGRSSSFNHEAEVENIATINVAPHAERFSQLAYQHSAIKLIISSVR